MNIRIVAMMVAVASLHGIAHADELTGDLPPRLVAQTLPSLTRPGGLSSGDELLRDARITVGYDIDERGHVFAAHIVSGEHASGRLNAAALKIVSGWVYEPARHDGKPVGTQGVQAVVIFKSNN